MSDLALDEVVPFSIYLNLEQGTRADLAVVSRASIEFVKAMKEAAFFAAPEIEDFRIELVSGTESSLFLHNLFRIPKATKDQKKILLGMAIGAGGVFGTCVATDLYNISPIHQAIVGAPSISDQDVRRIADEVNKAGRQEPVRSHVQNFYRTLDEDKAIGGVGTTITPPERPTKLVPRSEFRLRAGLDLPKVVTDTKRERTVDETLVLVSPVLEETDRKWRFKRGADEFGASIDDEKFLSELLSGKRRIPMVRGLRVHVQMTTVEERSTEGFWKPIDRRVIKVIGSPKAPPKQQALNFPPGKP